MHAFFGVKRTHSAERVPDGFKFLKGNKTRSEEGMTTVGEDRRQQTEK